MFFGIDEVDIHSVMEPVVSLQKQNLSLELRVFILKINVPSSEARNPTLCRMFVLLQWYHHHHARNPQTNNTAVRAGAHSTLGSQMDNNIWQRAAINELWRPGLSPVNMWHLKRSFVPLGGCTFQRIEFLSGPKTIQLGQSPGQKAIPWEDNLMSIQKLPLWSGTGKSRWTQDKLGSLCFYMRPLDLRICQSVIKIQPQISTE